MRSRVHCCSRSCMPMFVDRNSPWRVKIGT